MLILFICKSMINLTSTIEFAIKIVFESYTSLFFFEQHLSITMSFFKLIFKIN